MNVLLINGSPNKKGCTFTALSEVAGELEKQGIETHIFHFGTKAIRGCIACGKCKETGYCSYMAWLLKCIEAAKGIVPYPEQEPVRQRTNFIR